MANKIKVYSKFGDVRRQAARDGDDSPGQDQTMQGLSQGSRQSPRQGSRQSSRRASTNDPTPHGMSPDEIEELHRKLDSFEPTLIRQGDNRRSVVQELLSDRIPGATLYPRTRGGGGRSRRQGQLGGSSLMGGGAAGSTSISPSRPYQPEFTFDRQSYPIHRMLANRYWRLFYKMDPIIGTCIDMISELIWSDFQLTGEGVDGEPKERLEKMCETTQIRSIFPFFPREFLVTGEACPHAIWDEDEKLWSHVTLHNPDQLEIIYSPFMKMDPVAEFIPDDRLRQIVTSPNPQLRAIRERMPPELLAKLAARQNITLNPVNFTFIPRKQHPYDIRGTSILSRLWRVNLAEDSLWESFIATARRASRPIKMAKLGDAATNYIPGKEQEQKLIQLLAQAELDPEAWLCFVEGTPVTMSDGTVKPIEQVKVGDQVLDEKGSPQTVERAWCEGVPETVTEIHIKGKIKIQATHSHKWPVWAWPRTCACGCNEAVKVGNSFVNGHNKRSAGFDNGLVPALAYDAILAEKGRTRTRSVPNNWNGYQDLRSDELREGDYLLSPRTFKEREPDGVTRAHARLLGYYMAEGFTSENYLDYGTRPSGEAASTTWTFGLHEIDTWAKDVVALCQEIGLTAHLESRGSSALVTVRDRTIAQWFLHHGNKYSLSKRLSRDVMEWPLYLKEELLRGMFRGDGTQSLNHSAVMRGTRRKSRPQLAVQYATSSFDLVNQVHVILTQLGIGAGIRISKRKECFHRHPLIKLPVQTSVGYCAEGHQVSLGYYTQSTGQDSRRLADLIWSENSLSSEGQGHERPARPCYQSTDQNLFHEIKKVVTVPNTKPVYNLTVSGSHTYQVHHVATHNCWNYAINFEMVGDPQRALNIGSSYDLIERIKLIALGISKSLLTGDASYANSAAGLTVFLQRLLSMREMFEDAWIYPKFFKQTAIMNEWILPTPAELAHGVRTKRSHRELEEDNRYIVPVIEWEKSLNPAANTERISAFGALQQLGIKVSRRTALATVGLDFEQELKQIKAEQQVIQEIVGGDLQVAAAAGIVLPGMAPASPDGEGGGAPSLSVSPGLPEGSLGEFGPEDSAGGAGGPGGAPGGAPGEAPGAPGAPSAPGDTVPVTPEGASKAGEEGAKDKPVAPTTPTTPAAPRHSIWEPSLTRSLLELFTHFDHAELTEPWDRMLLDSSDAQYALRTEDPQMLWEATQQWLMDEGYPTRAITDLEDLLSAGGKIVRANIGSHSDRASRIQAILKSMTRADGTKLASIENMSDEEIMDLVEKKVLGITKDSGKSSFYTGIK